MKFKARILTSFLFTITLLISSIRPAFAYLGPFVYWKDVYIPAIYDDPNINLQKHIKETIMVIPMAMVDIGFSWILPTGTKFIRDCGAFVTSDAPPPLSLNLLDFLQPDKIPEKIKDLGTCGTDLFGAFSLAQASPINRALVQNQSRPQNHDFLLPNTRSFLQSSLNLPILATPAYAQGYGYNNLNTPNSAILNIWRTSRNVTYLLSSILLVVMGIMVMLRVKLSPQVVITIEQVIPQLAVTLLLITFSFAIVGFLIDLSYVAGYLISVLLSTSSIDTQSSWIGALVHDLTGQTKIFSPPSAVFDMFFSNNLLAGIFFQFFASIMWIFGNILHILWAFRDFVIPGLGILLGVIIVLLVMVILIIWAFLTFFSLLKVYVSFIMRIIFAPFIILLGLFPGGGGFGSWIQGLIQDLVTFLAVSVMFLVADILLLTVGGGDVWTPPQLGVNSDLALTFIAIGILLNIKKAPDMVAAFFAKKPFDFGSAIGEATKGAAPAIPWGLRGAQDYRTARAGGAGRWDSLKTAANPKLAKGAAEDILLSGAGLKPKGPT